jgi:hypothetical protein
MEKISSTDRVKKVEVHRIKKERNILHTVKRREANWRRNCRLKHVIEGKIEGMERRGRSRWQLLDVHKEMAGYWQLKEEALDRILWRTRSGKGYGPVARQAAE